MLSPRTCRTQLRVPGSARRALRRASRPVFRSPVSNAAEASHSYNTAPSLSDVTGSREGPSATEGSAPTTEPPAESPPSTGDAGEAAALLQPHAQALETQHKPMVTQHQLAMTGDPEGLELALVRTPEQVEVGFPEFGTFQRQWASKPKRICIFVEPSPFSYVCGYKNRYQNFIRNLTAAGDEVLVVTTHKGAPESFHGAKVLPSWSFGFFLYPSLPVSFAISPRLWAKVADFRPDIIHATSPGIMCFGALIVAKILSKPLVFSYHTHVPVYIPKYTFAFLVRPMWWILKFVHNAGDVTITTSEALGKELVEEGAAAAGLGCVWPKGIDCEIFNPSFKDEEMRHRLTGGEPDKPLIVHVGRLGAEKSLDLLKPLLDRLPGTRLAFVGDGPYREELERIFSGTSTVFMGMLSGDSLSRAYASGDVFLTPSESETLGFVVLEAMASGIPVVAARAGGIPDIIRQDGVTGFLFEPGNVEDAVVKTKALLDSAELRQLMAKAARKEVERFEWKSASRVVKEDLYPLAVWLHAKKQLRSWGRLLPWWVKKSEWQTIFSDV